MPFPTSLSAYFAPLTLQLTLLTFLTVAVWEVWGSGLIFLVKQNVPEWLRPAQWFLGLGIFIFAWFIANLFVPLNRPVILAILVGFTGIFLPIYVHHKLWQSWVKVIKPLLLPLGIFLVVAPIVWIKASLPPYLYDEMAYQLLTPAELNYSKVWTFSPGVYQIVPKSINILFHTTFALTATYSPARLIHFGTYFTSLLCVYLWLKKRWGTTRAVIFWLLAFSYTDRNIFTIATSAYVDTGMAAFSILGILTVLEMVLQKEWSLLPMSAVFWAMAIGSKYPAMVPLVAYSGLFTLTGILRNFKQNFNPRLIKTGAVALMAFVIFGGFWYVKNAIYTGSPVYPFLAKCNSLACADRSFFGTWTVSLTPSNVPYIIYLIFDYNRTAVYSLGIALGLLIFSARNMGRRMGWIIASSVMLQLVIIGLFSGFYFRYFFHLYTEVLLLLVFATISTANDHQIVAMAKKIFFIFLLIFSVYSFVSSVKRTYSANQVSIQEIAYARGKHDVFTWAGDRFREMAPIIKWCDQQSADKFTWLLRADPYMIWDDAGNSRMFFSKCLITDVSIPPDPAETFENLNLEYSEPFYLISNTPCQTPEEIEKASLISDRLYYANIDLVCNLKPIIPHLYQYVPQK